MRIYKRSYDERYRDLDVILNRIHLMIFGQDARRAGLRYFDNEEMPSFGEVFMSFKFRIDDELDWDLIREKGRLWSKAIDEAIMWESITYEGDLLKYMDELEDEAMKLAKEAGIPLRSYLR